MTEPLPIPESLLVPMLDDAAALLRDLDPTDFPAAVRPLAAFGKQGLTTGPARQQLRRALDVDDQFRSRAAERFLARPAVAAILEAWDATHALRRVEDAVERSDLPLLASALYAARPQGWAFGIGVVCASFDRQRLEKEADDDAKARRLQLATLDEARRRADEERARSRQDVARLEEQLRVERRSRRDRDQAAEQAIAAADRAREDAQAVIAKARAETEEAQARLEREATRAREAERRLRELRRQTLPSPAGAPSAGRAVDPAVVADAARMAERLAGTLGQLAEESRRTPVAPDPVVPAPSVSRARVAPPPGLDTDTVAALDAMLRTRGVVLIVDGYNVSMRGWGDARPRDQRDRLVAALDALHLRLRCDVVVVFDGSDVEVLPGRRRPGVRVVFSAADEEADPVVLREVDAHPPTVPVLVASSDRWVRDHADELGAAVVSADTLLGVLRR
ncbi:MAG TPA: NYN domain-containing protein [Acidimicrobiia bacterium]|nr:NYN domain-containing protein [Acidimicrobiia bacterium]